MKKKHTTQLIEGQFPQDKAKILLLELLSHKINYHQMKKFSNVERYGKDKERSEKRIAELLKEKKALTEWIDTLGENESLKISCAIKISTVKA